MSDKKIKVARIIARLNVGGPARHVVWLASGMNPEEFETVLIAGRVPDTEENMEYFADEYGVEPWFVKEMSRELSLSDLKALWKIWRKLVEEKPDVIHTHTAKAGTLGRIAGFFYKWIHPSTLIARPRNVRVFHTFHGHIFHNYYGSAKTKLFLFIERALARFASDKIIVITDQQKREINGDFGVGREEQFEIIRLGLDLSRLQADEAKRRQFRESLEVNENTLLIGIVGRLTAIKNHKLFIDAVSKFEKISDNSEVRFVVIGDGDLRKELEKHAEGTKIEFIGNRNDPDVFYSGLDAVVLSSKNEGTPLSLIEAMSFGLPWISTEVGGVIDLAGNVGSVLQVSSNREEYGIQNSEFREESQIDKQNMTVDKSGTVSPGIRIHERGILVDSEDPDGLCAAISTIVEDQEVCRSVSRSGAEWVRENYSKERLVKDIEHLYR